MRPIDDPRVAAELFCGQHSITDENTIDLLEETLREVLLSRRWTPSSLDKASPPSSRLTPVLPLQQPSPPPPLSPDDARAAAGPPSSRGGKTHSTKAAVEARDGRAGAAVVAAVVDAAEGGASKAPSADINVMEVARAMRAAAKASQDSADPASVVVDLVVNGTPAPLLFRLPRREPNDSNSQNHGDHDYPNDGLREEVQPRNEAEDGWEDEDLEEEKERAVAAAAAAWCREFGSSRTEDISFVEAEIRKAVEAAEATAAAREAAAAEAAEAGSAEAAAAAAGSDFAKAAAAASSTTTPFERKRSPFSVPPTPPSAGGRAEDAMRQGKARAHRQRLTMSSVLAPDVEKGTRIFWVQV
ncbi:unnamed protein product, partial [Hapterophycus canaliculatus]